MKSRCKISKKIPKNKISLNIYKKNYEKKPEWRFFISPYSLGHFMNVYELLGAIIFV